MVRKTLRAVGGHAVVEGARGRARGQIDRVRRAARGACRGGSGCCRFRRSRPAGRRRPESRSRRCRARRSPRDCRARCIARALEAGQGVAARVGRDDLGRARFEVALVDRDIAGVVVPGGLELRGRAEDEVVAVGGEPLLDQALVFGRRRRVRSIPSSPGRGCRSGRWSGHCRWCRRRSTGCRFRARRRRRCRATDRLRPGSRRTGPTRTGCWPGSRRMRWSSRFARGSRRRGRRRGWSGCRRCPGSRRCGPRRGPAAGRRRAG